MKKTVAIVGCLDTKASEIEYMIQEIERMGCESLLFDTSGLSHDIKNPKADISNQDIAKAAGYTWEEVQTKPKNSIMDIMMNGVRILVKDYYEKGQFQGIISAGGMQNTLLAKIAMMELPFGFPKINIAASMAVVEIDDALGRTDDVSTVNSIADIGGGINPITARIITNGLSALVGMMQYGLGEYSNIKKPVIGITNLGVMAKGASAAAKILNENGVETCMFHGTMHGAVVEKLVTEEILSGAMMLCIHDILTEVLGEHQFCKIPVLKAMKEKKIPTLISLSGMDVIDMSAEEFEAEKETKYKGRKYFYHNEFCVHVKSSVEEILRGGKLLAERLNSFESPVSVVIPLRGFRANTQPGEDLYEPEVDKALINYLHQNLKKEINIIDVDANANDETFSQAAAKEMLNLMSQGTNGHKMHACM